MVQWLRIYLPMQGTQVQSPVQEDSTCSRVESGQLSPYTTTSKSELQSLEASTTEALLVTAHARQQDNPAQWEACALQLKSSPCSLQLDQN